MVWWLWWCSVFLYTTVNGEVIIWTDLNNLIFAAVYVWNLLFVSTLYIYIMHYVCMVFDIKRLHFELTWSLCISAWISICWGDNLNWSIIPSGKHLRIGHSFGLIIIISFQSTCLKNNVVNNCHIGIIFLIHITLVFQIDSAVLSNINCILNFIFGRIKWTKS